MQGRDCKKEHDLSCKHNFCTRCWKNYLHTKIQDGKTDAISCPAYDCNIMVPVQVIERYVSPQMARKYLKFDLDCFVETNKSIKWCPYPACQRAVNLPESERQLWEDRSLVPAVSHAVDCGGGHFFCWDCGSLEAHAPLSCNLWQKWLARCSEVAPATGSRSSGKN
jgi:ankyrin repeat/IBR domain-containing protein 1